MSNTRDRHTITWAHTVIGGETAPYDYCAKDGDTPVGRITRVEHGPAAGEWQWSMYGRIGWGLDVTTYGREATKQQAADRVREVYEACRSRRS